MIKLFNLLFETGPSAQSAIPTLGDDRRKVSRTGTPAEEHGYLNIVDTMDLNVNNTEDDSTFPEEHSYLIQNKITP